MSKVKIALEDLFVPGGQGVRAHSKGDEVAADSPADLKRIHDAGWDDLVANPSTKAAAAVEPDPGPQAGTNAPTTVKGK
jgi:hypothetical protein